MSTNMETIAEILQSSLETAKKLGASAAKINYERVDDSDVSFENGRLKTTEVHQNVGYNIEVVTNGKKGSAAGNDLSSVDEMVERAIALAKVGSVAHFDAYPAASPVQQVAKYSDSAAELTLEKLIEGCQGAVDILKAYDPELFIEAGASREVKEKLIVTSGGVCHQSRGTMWSLGSYVQRTEGTDMLFAGFWRGWRAINEFFNPNMIAEHIVTDLKHAEELVDCPVGDIPVVVSPQMLGMFMMPIALGINGRNVAKGDSPLAGKLGDKLFDESLTIVDNPHIDYGYASTEIDSDGIPTKVISIVKNGVLQNFLYDLDSAGLAGAEPTGNNGSNPYAPVITPGQKSSQELISEIEDGVYIKELLGFGQSNIINGDFSANIALGYRVKNGKIVGRIKNAMIAGNVYTMLKENVLLSSDIDPMMNVPYAVLRGANVSA